MISTTEIDYLPPVQPLNLSTCGTSGFISFLSLLGLPPSFLAASLLSPHACSRSPWLKRKIRDCSQSAGQQDSDKTKNTSYALTRGQAFQFLFLYKSSKQRHVIYCWLFTWTPWLVCFAHRTFALMDLIKEPEQSWQLKLVVVACCIGFFGSAPPSPFLLFLRFAQCLFFKRIRVVNIGYFISFYYIFLLSRVKFRTD